MSDMRDDLSFLANLFLDRQDICPQRVSYLLYMLNDIHSNNKKFNRYIKMLNNTYELNILWNGGFCKNSLDRIEDMLETKEYPILKRRFNKYLLLNKI